VSVIVRTPDEQRSRPRLRTKIVTTVLLAALVVFAITRSSNAVVFFPSGTPVSLPAAGKLTELTEAQFEGVLVGLRGKPVIVNIWASWCAPCRTETPLLERTWEAHKDDVIVIGVDSKDAASLGLGFMREFNVSYSNIFDGTGDIRAKLGLRGFPTTYVFGADGKLRTTVVGGLSEQRLASILVDLKG
jgi:cytochrome c biogenesis protein CcmG/thiol:disulfide interchange protein DsbE